MILTYQLSTRQADVKYISPRISRYQTLQTRWCVLSTIPSYHSPYDFHAAHPVRLEITSILEHMARVAASVAKTNH